MSLLASLASRRRILAGVAVLALVLVLIAVYLLSINPDVLGASDDQPIAFNHQAHAQNGIQCQYCHTGVDNSPVAGIPSVYLCMGCHEYVATEHPEIQELTGYWERQEPIPWQRVYDLPSFAFFNHAPHISAGVSCGSCHGDVANMTVAEPAVEMTMGFCLDCHAEQENKDALYDCLICHR